MRPTERITTRSPATAAGLRPPRWRRWATAGIVAATSLSTALVTAPAGASGTPPQISVVTGSAGTKTVSLGHPQKATTAKLSPGHVAFNPANGDEAVSVRTSGGQARVYLIAGASGPNEYHIATSITSTTHTPLYGTLVKGDAYLMAGNGTVGIVGFPGGGTTTTSGESPHVGAVTNPVAPVSLAFDNSGNLLIGEALPLATATETGIQIVAKAACTSACPYKYTSLAAGGLYTIAASGQVTGATLTPAISFTYQVYGYGLAVDAQGNIIDGSNNLIVFLNEGTATLTRYGKSLAHHKATLIAGTTTGAATCGDGSVNVPATGASSPALQWPHPFVDPSGNVYFSDNQVSSGKGCTWVLPAESGSLDGMTVTAGRMYSLTGAATTTAETSGAVANKTSFPNAVAAVTDAAGNVVVALSGTTPAVRVIAESTATYYDQAMTAGHVYTISGGPAATRTTTPGNATGFKLPGAARPTKPPAFGLTSITPGAPGDLLLTDGSSATTASLYEITKGPLHGAPTVTGVTPSKGPLAGGTKVTITGSNFTTVTSVKFGAKTVTSITSRTPTKLTVTDPTSSTAGPVTVSVTAAGGTGTKPTGFDYVAGPTITKVTPAAGPTAGGTVVTLTGSGFVSGATSVTFGGTTIPDGSVTFVSATAIKVTSPSHGAGTVTVKATTAAGTSGSGEHFTYENAPTITKVTPAAGPTAGGTVVTLTGSGFVSGATTVTFGGTTIPDGSVTFVSATAIKVTSPSHTAGTVTVKATTAGGTSGSGEHFTYEPVPTITKVTPGAGPTAGGTVVTLTGSGFVSGATTVTFGGTTIPAGSVTFVSATAIKVTSPSHTAGTVTVKATTAGGTSASGEHFTYVTGPAVTKVTPGAGPTGGGTTITITGSGFVSGATTVTFGGTTIPAGSVTFVSASEIKVTSPLARGGHGDSEGHHRRGDLAVRRALRLRPPVHHQGHTECGSDRRGHGGHPHGQRLRLGGHHGHIRGHDNPGRLGDLRERHSNQGHLPFAHRGHRDSEGHHGRGELGLR